jgi:hypothetical protein
MGHASCRCFLALVVHAALSLSNFSLLLTCYNRIVVTYKQPRTQKGLQREGAG